MTVWNQCLVCVRDIAASSAWYQQVLGAESGHGGDEYDQLMADGELIMQLHHIDVEDHHGVLADPDVMLGNGVALWFEVADFQAAVSRIRASGARVEAEPHENPNALQQEIWLVDPDGYRVVIAGPSAYRPR